MPPTFPWNTGKSVGQKAPCSPRDVQTLKQILADEGNLRDLALFSIGIDTMLRGSGAISHVSPHCLASVKERQPCRISPLKITALSEISTP